MYGSDSITLTNGESETVPTLQKQEREAIVPSIRTPMQRSSKTRSRKHEPHSGKHQGTPAPATPPDLAAASRRGAGDRKKTFNEGQKKGNHSKSKPNEDSRTGKRLKWNECIGEAEQQSGDAESVDGNVLRDSKRWPGPGDSLETLAAQTEQSGCRMGGKHGTGSPEADARGPLLPAWGRPTGTRSLFHKMVLQDWRSMWKNG